MSPSLPHTLVNVIVPATTSMLMSKRLMSTLKLLCVMSYWCLQENSPSAALSFEQVFSLASYFCSAVSSSGYGVSSRFWPQHNAAGGKVRPSMPPPLPYVGDRFKVGNEYQVARLILEAASLVIRILVVAIHKMPAL